MQQTLTNNVLNQPLSNRYPQKKTLVQVMAMKIMNKISHLEHSDWTRYTNKEAYREKIQT